MAATTSRLLKLLSLLQARPEWPAPLLATRLGVSDRTVRRDVDRLREMGYRIHATMGPNGGYRLDAGSQLPPLLFDDEQVIALAVALQSAPLTRTGIDESARRALDTVRQVMPSHLRHRLDSLSFTTIDYAPGDPPAGPVAPDALLVISRAIEAHEELRFDYAGDASPLDDVRSQPSRVQPHHLVNSRGRWYVVGFSLDHDDWRILRVDRMAIRTSNGRRFAPRTVPGGDVAAFLSARFKGSREADRWPCIGRAVLHLPARRVAPFAGDGIVEDLGDDRCALESGSWSWVSLAASLNRFDCDIDVIGPPELVDAFAILAERNASTAASGSGGTGAPHKQ